MNFDKAVKHVNSRLDGQGATPINKTLLLRGLYDNSFDACKKIHGITSSMIISVWKNRLWGEAVILPAHLRRSEEREDV